MLKLRHSGAGRNPGFWCWDEDKKDWTPAFAGVTLNRVVA
jgi:hypothetical protein